MKNASKSAVFAASLLASTAIGVVPSASENWAGAYVGAHVGYGSDDVGFFASKGTTPFPIPESQHDVDGILGGVEAGYNWQVGDFVFGLAGGISGSGIEGDALDVDVFGGKNARAPGPNDILFETSVNWIGTLRGRLGFDFGSVMAFATFGLAIVDVEHAIRFGNNIPGSDYKSSETEATWTVGGGLEVALIDQWSLKGEYLYIDLDDRDFDSGGGRLRGPGLFAQSDGLHSFRLGVNYRFNMPGLN